MSTNMHVLYLVNAHIPNERANGVQIAHTCEALGRHVTLTLATRMTYDYVGDSYARYGIVPTFSHIKIFCIDIPNIPFRYIIRNTSFFLCAAAYVVYFFVSNFIRGRSVAIYVRGEIILSLIPFTLIFPIFFETHQIRNYAWLYRIALRYVRGIIVVTDRLKQKFIEEYKIPAEKIVVARDAVDIEKFTAVEKDVSLWHTHNIPVGKKIVLYSGTLADEKGVHTLAQCATLLPDDVHIVFLGGTDTQIAIFINLYGHQSNITILGRVNHTEVSRYMVSADVLVLPDSAKFTYSNLYTSPMKLFEYMASEVPILASDVPSLREVLDETSATFFDADSVSSCAEQIVYILAHQEEAHSRAHVARLHVDTYTWEKRGEVLVTHIVNRM